jgi:hypothetical protein
LNRSEEKCNDCIFLVKSDKHAILLLKQNSTCWVEKGINSYVRLGHIGSLKTSLSRTVATHTWCTEKTKTDLLRLWISWMASEQTASGQ